MCVCLVYRVIGIGQHDVYLLQNIIPISPAPVKRGRHFVADGGKTELRLRVALSGSCFAVTGKSRGFARSGALGQPGAVMDLRACPGVSTRSLSGVLRVSVTFRRFGFYSPQILGFRTQLFAHVADGIQNISAVREHPDTKLVIF